MASDAQGFGSTDWPALGLPPGAGVSKSPPAARLDPGHREAAEQAAADRHHKTPLRQQAAGTSARIINL